MWDRLPDVAATMRQLDQIHLGSHPETSPGEFCGEERDLINNKTLKEKESMGHHKPYQSLMVIP